MRPQATAGQLEQRRRQAIRLRQRGKTVATMSQKVKAGQSSVWRWLQPSQQSGLSGLRARPIPGRPSYLSAGQKEHLVRVLLRGAQAAGDWTELWTLKRIAKGIWKEFHRCYHPNALWHRLRAMGWSCQNPERRSCQRDEGASAHWRR